MWAAVAGTAARWMGRTLSSRRRSPCTALCCSTAGSLIKKHGPAAPGRNVFLDTLRFRRVEVIVAAATATATATAITTTVGQQGRVTPTAVPAPTTSTPFSRRRGGCSTGPGPFQATPLCPSPPARWESWLSAQKRHNACAAGLWRGTPYPPPSSRRPSGTGSGHMVAPGAVDVLVAQVRSWNFERPPAGAFGARGRRPAHRLSPASTCSVPWSACG
eukprot:gene8183-biopygen10627